MVAACRRIIDRQLTCAPLWWLCARLLCSPEPMREAHLAVTELESDPTAKLLAEALPDDVTAVLIGWPDQTVGAVRRRGDVELLLIDVDGESDEAARQLERLDVDAVPIAARNAGVAVRSADLVIIDALAVGPDAALVPAGSLAAAAAARHADIPVWAVAGVGRLMPARMFEALAGRWSDSVDPFGAVEELMPLDLIDRLAGVGGVVEVAEGLRRTDCPVAPELYRLAG